MRYALVGVPEPFARCLLVRDTTSPALLLSILRLPSEFVAVEVVVKDRAVRKSNIVAGVAGMAVQEDDIARAAKDDITESDGTAAETAEV